MATERAPVAVALGSNVGDRHAHLAAAIDRLRAFLLDLHVSPFYDTAPVGVVEQPRFLNGIATGTTDASPRAALERLLAIERELGRTRPFPGAPRTIDLDLILYGDVILDEPDLKVPHPRFRERAFVLQPLNDVAPDWIDPVTRATVAELLRRLREGQHREG